MDTYCSRYTEAVRNDLPANHPASWGSSCDTNWLFGLDNFFFLVLNGQPSDWQTPKAHLCVECFFMHSVLCQALEHNVNRISSVATNVGRGSLAKYTALAELRAGCLPLIVGVVLSAFEHKVSMDMEAKFAYQMYGLFQRLMHTCITEKHAWLIERTWITHSKLEPTLKHDSDLKSNMHPSYLFALSMLCSNYNRDNGAAHGHLIKHFGSLLHATNDAKINANISSVMELLKYVDDENKPSIESNLRVLRDKCQGMYIF